MNVMDHLHLAGVDEEDPYGDFNNYNAALDTENLENDTGFQEAVKTSYGRRPPTQARMGTQAGGRGKGFMPPSSMGRPGTGMQDGAARPMTAVKAAGFRGSGQQFDPMGGKGPAPPLEKKNLDTPEEKIKALERMVNQLIEESCQSSARGENQVALEKAKEAGRKERMLVREKEKLTPNEQVNLDLTYSVLFNLANQYSINDMFTEALNTYHVIIKNKMFSNAGRLKINIGNLYFKEKNFPKAIKYYRMALDQVPNTHKNIRIKMMQNIGIAFVKLGQYSDAITSFEHIMGEEPNFRTGFNLILCHYAMGDREKMKHTFQKLLTVDLKIDDEDKYMASSPLEVVDRGSETQLQDDKHAQLLLEVIKNDMLRKIEREKKLEAERCIMMASKIISPAVENTFTAGYDWCIEQVKSSQYMELAHNLEIDKAIGYLKQKDFSLAIETLKSFEKKDTKVACTAATNLSFLYHLELEQQNADKYAEVALQADRYNPPALVNKGNVLFAQGDHEKAREYYMEALQNDSSCVEALYNLGLCNKRLHRYEDALNHFSKLHVILRNSSQVVYHIADIHDQLGKTAQAMEWFMQLVGIVPTDATILQRLGEMYDAEGDKSQAFQYHYDSYRYNPTNISVIEWLGAYYIDSQFCEKAIQYFDRAAIIQPSQVKWQLMVASCHRRSGNYQQSLETYKQIHKKFPDNIECLKFLVRLGTDLGLKETQDYANKLKKAEKQAKLREERISSGSRRGSGRRRAERQDSADSASSRTSSAVRGGSATRGGSARAGSATRAGSASSLLSDGRQGSGQQTRGRSMNLTEEDNEPYQPSHKQEVDATYSDPLGPQVERPKTAASRRHEMQDEFGDEELGDDLLPE